MKGKVTRVLLVWANPRGTDAIRLGEEDRTLRESIRLSPHRDRIKVETIQAATIGRPELPAHQLDTDRTSGRSWRAEWQSFPASVARARPTPQRAG
jgi:hypothetical protein